MDVIMFYMKAASLNRQTKLFRKIVGNAQNAIGNFHCYQLMLKLNPYLSVDRLGYIHQKLRFNLLGVHWEKLPKPEWQVPEQGLCNTCPKQGS